MTSSFFDDITNSFWRERNSLGQVAIRPIHIFVFSFSNMNSKYVFFSISFSNT